MPHKRTIKRWLSENLAFQQQYARAKEEMAEHFAEEILEIADDGSNDWIEREVESGKLIKVPDHEHIAVRTAVAIRERFKALADEWEKRGYDLGLGIGIATGYATLGRIGFEGRYDYGAVGNVVNLAARLGDAASAGEILLSQRAHAPIDAHIVSEPLPKLQLKGISRPVVAIRVISLCD